jgi:hypothetical protein
MKYKPMTVGEELKSPKFIWPQILLHPNIPKPLHGLNPRSIFGKEWWDIERKKAYEVNNFCCWACGIDKNKAKHHRWLEAHECYEIDYSTGIAEMKMISALCHLCHNYIHNGRLQELLNVSSITIEFYNEVMFHGSNLLAERMENIGFPKELLFLQSTLISLEMVKLKMVENVDWKDWKLIIDGKEYSPIHKSYEEWLKFYHG